MDGRRQVGRCVVAAALLLAACGSRESLPPLSAADPAPEYVIGPLDTLQIFVWKNQDVSTTVPVRPDGRISMPLVSDLQAAGRTPTQLGQNIEAALSKYIRDPTVSVVVQQFIGALDQQVRVLGEAARPQALPY